MAPRAGHGHPRAPITGRNELGSSPPLRAVEFLPRRTETAFRSGFRGDRHFPYKKSLKRFVGRALPAQRECFGAIFCSKMFVVAFHRVNDKLAADGLTVSAAGFDSFCDFFSRYFTVVPLSEQVEGCHRGRAMGGTLSITFDDGYVDNSSRSRRPSSGDVVCSASLLVSSGFIGTDYVAPWDRGLRDPPKWMTWEQVQVDLSRQGS